MTPEQTAAAHAGEARHVLWDGEDPAVHRLRAVLAPFLPNGTVRVVLQQLRLHEHGRLDAIHELIDVIVDVEGNLVVMALGETVRGDAAAAARLDAELAAVRAALDAHGLVGCDSLEIVLDADGSEQVLLAFGLELAAQDLDERPEALHGGEHHVAQHSAELDDLRDRLDAQQRRRTPWWRRLRRAISDRIPHSPRILRRSP